MESVEEEISELEEASLQLHFNSSYHNETQVYDMYNFYRTEHITFISIIFVIIIVGNTILLCALCQSKRENSSRMDFFIMHLAIADLLVAGVSVSTDLIWKVTLEWKAGPFACRLVRYLQSVVVCASTYVLVSLSIDRVNAIVRPMGFYYRGLVAKILVISAWSCALLFCLPIFILNNVGLDNYNRTQCGISFSQYWHWQAYFTSIAVLVFIAPALVIICCYMIIMGVIWHSAQRLIPSAAHETNSQTGSGSSILASQSCVSRSSSRGLLPQAKVKTIKMTLVIVIAFIICWSPYFIFDLLDVYGYIPQSQRKIPITIFIQSLAHLNSAVNPLIYGVFSSNVCARMGRPFVFKCCVDRRFYNMHGQILPNRRASQSSVSRSVCTTSVVSRYETPNPSKMHTEDTQMTSALVTLHEDTALNATISAAQSEPDLLVNISDSRRKEDSEDIKICAEDGNDENSV